MSSISSTHSAIADPIMSEKPAMETEASPRQSDSEEIETARKDDDVASSDSGSLTQRAALIRDELLGNDSLEQDSVHGSAVSSGTSEGGTAHSSLQEGSQDDKDDLEERLKTSSIAQSLRHIALAFDEKSRELESLRNIHQTHDAEIAQLRAEIENKKKETSALTAELNELNATNDTLQLDLEALKSEVEHKDELLCFSDRISSRLFEMIHAIRAQVEEAETLSPAIRSLSSSSSSSTSSESSTLITSTSSEVNNKAFTLSNVPTPFETLIKKIEAKYAN